MQKLRYVLSVSVLLLSMLLTSCTTEPVKTTKPTPSSLQIHLDGSEIPQFASPLPVLDVTGAASGTIKTILAGTSQIVIDMEEFRANMLPDTFTPASGKYNGTWVWGYVTAETKTGVTRDTYTGPVVVAARNTPSEFKFVNNLGSGATTNVLAYKNSIDQSLHWANPDGVDRYARVYTQPVTWVGNPNHYTGPVPAAVHLHGGEVPAAIDGGPESWFTSSGKHGAAFYSKDGNTNGNYAIYRYPNMQPAAPIWFHDHTLGATRLNVYAGLAGAYLLTDPALSLPAGLSATGLRGGALGLNPLDDTLIPLVIQDRMFDTNGQLYFPAGPPDSINPEHPYWVPEFFGDTIAVNGKVWPYLEVKAQRYRFLLINGSNSRTYILTFQGNTAGAPAIWQIGTDGGYLDTPVSVDPLRVMPGERAEFIIDFAGLVSGTKLILYNWGPDEPFGDGIPGVDFDKADAATTGKIMQFRIVGGAPASDSSFNPAAPNATILSGADKIIRLVNPITGMIADKVKADLTRTLTLNEVAREESITVNGVEWEGGPLEALINNTSYAGVKYDDINPGKMTDLAPINGAKADGIGNFLTEFPAEGTTEIWQIVNLTMDAHPIHTHLAQFQLLNREGIYVEEAEGEGEEEVENGYWAAYASAFPGGNYIPGYGPPLIYSPSAASGGTYGGNPDITPYLSGIIQSPDANEAGWKDTIFSPPGTVTRFIVRWAPTDLAIQPSTSAQMIYPFLPNDLNPVNIGSFFDYVWHCHIVDHEDNEMMRPDAIVPKSQARRTYRIGSDY